MALPLIKMGKLCQRVSWCTTGGRWIGALLGLAVYKKPVQLLSGDSEEASGYSRVEFRGEAQDGDTNSEVSSSMWLGLELWSWMRSHRNRVWTEKRRGPRHEFWRTSTTSTFREQASTDTQQRRLVSGNGRRIRRGGFPRTMSRTRGSTVSSTTDGAHQIRTWI